MNRSAWVLSAACVPLAALAATAAASPVGAVVAGPVVGDETGVGGALGGRLGLRTAAVPTRWAVFAEVAGLYFLGFGPHGHIAGYHALAAGEWSRGRDRLHAHAFAGACLDHWARAGTENDQAIDTTVISGALGLGVSAGRVRLDLEATFPVAELARATDSPIIGPQLLLLVGVGRP